MSDYNKSVNFAAKDGLETSHPDKVIQGTEIDTEFNNIETALDSKADAASPTLTGSGTAVNLTVSGTLDATGTFQIGSTSVTATAAELNILDGVTSTAAELNILDGVTATAAELNYNDITTLGTAEASKVVTVSAGSAIDFANVDITNVDIDSGAIDGTAIGGSSAAAGTFTALTSNGIDDNATSTAITIDSSDRVSIGTTDVSDFLTGAMIEDGLEIQSDTAAMASIYQYQYNASDSADLSFYRARGTKASPTAVASGDVLGQVWAGGHDGTDWHPAADMRFIVDGTPADDPTDMPGRVQFHTCADGSVAPTEAMRINNDNTVSIGTTDSSSYLTTRMWGGLSIEHDTAYKASLYLSGYETNVNASPEIWCGRSRGSKGSETAVVDGDQLYIPYSVGGHDGTDTLTNAAKCVIHVDGTVASNSVPGRISWHTMKDGETSNAERMRLDNAGNLLLGGTATAASSAGNLHLFNGTVPSASVTNGVVLYAEDAAASSELKVRDEAGNVSTLSPHNFSLIPDGPSEDMAWAYYSEKGGKRINVDMLKLARKVEELTGEKLVYEE